MVLDDDCDIGSCSAEALVLVELIHGQLSFCGHHWDEVAAAALPSVLRVTDRRRGPFLPLCWLPDPETSFLHSLR
jgi:hypothetical protein